MTTNSTSLRARGLALALALTAALGCSVAGPNAHAAVYTVDSPEAFQNALDKAAGTVNDADEIQLAPGVYGSEIGFHYDSGPNEANSIAIKGTPGQTVLEAAAGNVQANTKVLELHGTGADASYVQGVKIRMPLVADPNNFVAGLLLERASAINVVVEPFEATGKRALAGILMWDGARVRATKVTMPKPEFETDADAIWVAGSDAEVEDVQTIGGKWGIRFDHFADGFVRRARVDARGSSGGIECDACKGLDVDDSVVRVDDEAVGLGAIGSADHWVLTNASHVTVVGDGAGSGIGAMAAGLTGTKGTMLRLDNCVLSNVTATLYRSGQTGGTADMVTRSCNYPAQKELGGGPGKIDALDRTDVEPGFVYPYGGDFRLRWNSELIDAGRTFVLFAESPFTLDHANRIVDGDLNGEAKPDLGAYEYQAHPPKVAIAPLPTLYANEPFTVDGSKSFGVDPGEPVAFKWALPGGATADTPTVGLKLPAGTHEVALTVTDPTGKTATEHRTLTVVNRPGGTSSPAALLSRVRVSPARVKRGSAPKLTFALASRATVSAKVQRRAGKRWRKVREIRRTLAAGRRGMKLPRATRAGRWRVVVTARASTARGTARAAYRVR